MTEKRTITITAYRDPAGRPTCAVDFRTGMVCRLLQTARMGRDDVCALQTGRRPCLQRYDGGTGYLVPTKTCPVWAEVLRESEERARADAECRAKLDAKRAEDKRYGELRGEISRILSMRVPEDVLIRALAVLRGEV